MHTEVENWWKQARRDLTTAENSFDSQDYYASAFWCQQAVEKALKGLIIKRQGTLLKIHDLVKLARDAGAPEEIIIICSRIAPVYVEVRYPEADEFPAEKVDHQKAQDLLRLSREVLSWIEKKL